MKSFFAGKKFPSPFSVLQGRRGVAILLAMSAIMILTYIAMEVSEDSLIDYSVASSRVGRLQAHYAAKSAVEMGLLRIHLYRKALATFGEQLKGKESMLDPLWQFPFSWPPPLPDEMNIADKDAIQTSLKDSLMKSQYLVTIQSEGAKIDLNDLRSPVKTVREGIEKQILRIFELKMESDEEFREVHRNTNFQELVWNLTDWVDKDSISLNGGDERSRYQDRQDQELPPNQPFKTLDELHLVAGMTDDIFDLIADQVTLYGSMGVNVNTATKEILASLDPQLTETVIKALLERRSDLEQGGPFPDSKEFLEFLGTQGVNTQNFNPNNVVLLFGVETSFRVVGSGISGKNTKEIVAVTVDVESLKERLSTSLTEAEKKEKGEAGGPDKEGDKSGGPGDTKEGGDKGDGADGGKSGDSDPTKTKYKMPKGRPTVVFWDER